MTETDSLIDTATEPAAVPTTTATQDWDAQFTELRTRYPRVRESILVALHILTQNPDIALDDAKAQASLRGTRITAASIAAARRLLSPPDERAIQQTPAPSVAQRRSPRARRADAEVDVEALVRTTLSEIEAQGAAEAERLRAAIKKAIAVLQEAIA